MVGQSSIILYLVFKILTMIVGVSIIMLGFKLFAKGFSSPSGNIELSLFGEKIKMANAAPGIYLFVLGTLVILLSIFKGVDLKSQTKKSLPHSDSTISKLNISDTSSFEIKTINIDSIFSLAKEHLKNGKILNAYKYCCLAKGAAFSQDSLPNQLRNDITKTLQLIERKLNEIAAKSEQTPLSVEETKSVTINEEIQDTTDY